MSGASVAYIVGKGTRKLIEARVFVVSIIVIASSMTFLLNEENFLAKLYLLCISGFALVNLITISLAYCLLTDSELVLKGLYKKQ